VVIGNVGRFAGKSRAFRLRRVAGADRDCRCCEALTTAVCDLRDAGEGRTQVPFDVDRERLERRNVEYAAALRLGRLRREHQAIEAPQEGRQCLAAASRRKNQGRFAAGDGRPAQQLWTRRRIERRRKPLAHCWVKWVQRISALPGHVVIL
jgi:hypothetical protein